jgi:hypothetical protein
MSWSEQTAESRRVAAQMLFTGKSLLATAAFVNVRGKQVLRWQKTKEAVFQAEWDRLEAEHEADLARRFK